VEDGFPPKVDGVCLSVIVSGSKDHPEQFGWLTARSILSTSKGVVEGSLWNNLAVIKDEILPESISFAY
jgi:hypothetical protein